MYTIRPIVLDSDEPNYQAISDQAYFATLHELALPFDTKLNENKIAMRRWQVNYQAMLRFAEDTID